MSSAAAKYSQRLLSRVLLVLTLVSIVVLCAGIWRMLDVPLRGFVIDGELTGGERLELQQALATMQLRGILSTSLTSVAQTVRALPWAREISVRRQWPDKLVVTLHKANPVARWGEDQYLSAFGDLLSLPDNYVGLPRFDVSVASPVAAMEVYRLLDQILARENLSIQELQQNPQGEWRLSLVRGPLVVLGAEQLNERMHRFLLLYRRVLSQEEQPAAYIDARYTNGLAVRYVEPLAADNPQISAASVDAAPPAWVARNQPTTLIEEEPSGG